MSNRITYSNESGGISIVIPTGEISLEEVLLRDVPEGAQVQILSADQIPVDRTFRAAWRLGEGCIEHDLSHCRRIAHERRRAARAAEFAPYDEILSKRIPGYDEKGVEEKRQEIRDRYDKMQQTIDKAKTVDKIKLALEG